MKCEKIAEGEHLLRIEKKTTKLIAMLKNLDEVLQVNKYSSFKQL